MKNNDLLWKNRAQAYAEKAIGYFRLIGNSGFLFAVYATFIISSYYYAKGLKQLPEDFPAEILLVIVFTLFAFNGQIRTFVRPADPVFLLPSESKLISYFLKSYIYSLAFHCFYLILVLIVVAPIYLQFIDSNFSGYLVIGILLLVVKAWNLALIWQEKRLGVREYFLIASLLRLLLTFFIVYGLMNDDILGVTISLLLMVIYFIYAWKFIRERHTLKWERLIEIENKMLKRLYRVANLFTDVPEVQNRVKPRRFLTSWINYLSNNKKNAYFKLFMRTFFRADDYFASYVRLTIIGCLLLLILPKGIFQLVILVLLLYITSVQLLSIWQSKSDHVLFRVFPVSEELKINTFQRFITVLIIFQGLVFSVILVIVGSRLLLAVIFLLIALLFAYIFANWKVKSFIQNS